MVQFPSSLEFVSFLQYSPSGTTDASKQSRHVRDAIKNDLFLGGKPGIDYAAQRVQQELPNYPFLADCFSPAVTLVPVPRSSPLTKKALWPPLRICEALHSLGLAEGVATLLERTTPVAKSSRAAPGGRPNPPDHYVTTRLLRQQTLGVPSEITFVDDFITRGSTFVGLYPHLKDAFPNARIRCFALVRTRSGDEVDQILAPVQGTITYSHSLHRSP